MSSSAEPNRPFYIWEGVYDSFASAAANAKGPGFKGETYCVRSLGAATECLTALRSGTPIPQFHKQRSTFLPCTVAMMLAQSDGVRVLDFGGGLGIGYMTLAESIPHDLGRIDYSILEVPEVAAAARGLLGDEVTYLSCLPRSNTFDLIHAASSFQYIEHWQHLVQRFASLSPRHILLSDVFAGAVKSFATLQNYYGSQIPHWFLNLQELLDVFEQHGYKLQMKSFATSRRLNVEDDLPMDNFPASLRLQQTLHLLFQTARVSG
jgi:putative methyltransferase (TIGR04325 family)